MIHIDIETLYAHDVKLLIKPSYFTMHIQYKNFILSVSIRSFICLVRCFHSMPKRYRLNNPMFYQASYIEYTATL